MKCPADNGLANKRRSARRLVIAVAGGCLGAILLVVFSGHGAPALFGSRGRFFCELPPRAAYQMLSQTQLVYLARREGRYHLTLVERNGGKQPLQDLTPVLNSPDVRLGMASGLRSIHNGTRLLINETGLAARLLVVDLSRSQAWPTPLKAFEGHTIECGQDRLVQFSARRDTTEARVFRLSRPDELERISLQTRLVGVGFRPEDEVFLSAWEKEGGLEILEFRIWPRLEQLGTNTVSLPNRGELVYEAFSPDGKKLAIGQRQETWWKKMATELLSVVNLRSGSVQRLGAVPPGERRPGLKWTADSAGLTYSSWQKVYFVPVNEP